MPQFSGNTSTSALSTAYNIPAHIISWSIINKSGTNLAYSVSILFGSSNNYIAQGTLSSGGEVRVTLTDVLILAGEQIYLLGNGSFDYNFTIR